MNKLKKVLLTMAAASMVMFFTIVPAASVSAEDGAPIVPASSTDWNQAAFDAAYPDGIAQGEELDLTQFYTGDITKLIIDDTGSTGEVLFSTGVDTDGLLYGYKTGAVTLHLTDDGDLDVTLTFDVHATPTAITLDTPAKQLQVGESFILSLDTIPPEAWWFWLELAENSSSILVTATISDTSVIDVEQVMDEFGDWTGEYKVTALKAGTATVSIETEAGDTATSTITVVGAPTAPVVAAPSIAPAAAGPATGDTTNTTFYGILALGSIAGMALVLRKRKNLN